MIVRYTRRAVADLDEARAYIALDRPRVAGAMALRIRAAIAGLRRFPERGHPARMPRTPFVVP